MIQLASAVEQRQRDYRYRGPERRQRSQDGANPMQAMVDELEHGIVLLTADLKVVLLNHCARVELDDSHPLQMLGEELRAREPLDVARLHGALTAAAERGLRRLITLGQGDQRVTLAVVPLMESGSRGPHACMVSLGKRQMCERLSVHWYAQAHGLTPAEARVLDALSTGVTPRDVAAMLGVQLTTIRTQLCNVRAKTGTRDLRALLHQVALLPPMVSSLRQIHTSRPAMAVMPAMPAMAVMPLACAHGHLHARAA